MMDNTQFSDLDHTSNLNNDASMMTSVKDSMNQNQTNQSVIVNGNLNNNSMIQSVAHNGSQLNKSYSNFDPDRSTHQMAGHNKNHKMLELPLKFEEIVLESNEVDVEALKQIEGFKEQRFKDSIYVGIMSNNKRHGKGVMKYPNGR